VSAARSSLRFFLAAFDERPVLTPKPDPAFDAKCTDICAVYKAVATSDAAHRTIPIDEMTGIQMSRSAVLACSLSPGREISGRAGR
jgi:hypothetical protein